jgi:competence protein ComEC
MKHFLTFVFTLAINSPAFSSELQIHFIDVGQADATLFVSPSGHTLLVDSGKNGSGSEIKMVLDRLTITTIDHYVTTHYHTDHYGGIDELIGAGIIVINAYDRGDKCCIGDRVTQPRYIEYDNAVGNRAVHLTRGQSIPLDPSMNIRVLSSGGVVLGEQDPVETGEDENDMSVTLLVQLGDFKMFVGGDIHTRVENKIAKLNIVSNIDVYQSNHHGSSTSSAQTFMDKITPSLIVISNGNHGGHKHPKQSTLDRYAAMTPKPTVLQVNEYTKGGIGGNVHRDFIADLAPDGNDGSIVLRTDIANGKYNVTYSDKTIEFDIKSNGVVPTGLKIKSLMPNPEGSDRLNETVTLENTSNQLISLHNITLKDASDKIWIVEGDITAGTEKIIQRNGMPMSLNNSGDTIELIGPDGVVIDTMTYSSSTEGVSVPH